MEDPVFDGWKIKPLNIRITFENVGQAVIHAQPKIEMVNRIDTHPQNQAEIRRCHYIF